MNKKKILKAIRELIIILLLAAVFSLFCKAEDVQERVQIEGCISWTEFEAICRQYGVEPDFESWKEAAMFPQCYGDSEEEIENLLKEVDISEADN